MVSFGVLVAGLLVFAFGVFADHKGKKLAKYLMVGGVLVAWLSVFV